MAQSCGLESGFAVLSATYGSRSEVQGRKCKNGVLIVTIRREIYDSTIEEGFLSYSSENHYRSEISVARDLQWDLFRFP